MPDRELTRTYYAKCHACGLEWLTSVPTSVLTSHELRYHDGAQTCWTASEEETSEVAAEHERIVAEEGHCAHLPSGYRECEAEVWLRHNQGS